MTDIGGTTSLSEVSGVLGSRGKEAARSFFHRPFSEKLTPPRNRVNTTKKASPRTRAWPRTFRRAASGAGLSW